MGRRGRAPAPAKVQLAKGETRPSRVNFMEPTPSQKPPKMPGDMDDKAKTVWKRVLREMGPSGIILGADHDILRAYCEAVVTYNRNRKLLWDSGPLVRGARGKEWVANPLARLVREERDAIRLLARELGLSPAARAGIHLDMNGGAITEMDAVLPAGPQLRVVNE